MAAISICLELGIAKDVIIEKIIEKYNLTNEKAIELYAKVVK